LTYRTEERRSAVLYDTLDNSGAAARWATQALAVVDTKAVLKHSKFAIGLSVVAQRRAPGFNGVQQDRTDRRGKTFGVFFWLPGSASDSRSLAFWG
jgi:hypothetical protein